ncbi:MAG: hypothetical protein MUC50_03960 [Myxococcota bacterium]|nr:hypothetical protein [Myxococcota bacterium]
MAPSVERQRRRRAGASGSLFFSTTRSEALAWKAAVIRLSSSVASAARHSTFNKVQLKAGPGQ